jgi:hypothetical protein
VSGRPSSFDEHRVRRVAADAWLFRWRVEVDAEARFARLAGRLSAIGACRDFVRAVRDAAQDERRHALVCAEIAEELGADVRSPPAAAPREIAPATLLLRGRVLYELVAACCITETESMGVLTTLLDAARAPRLRRRLRELASDEVRHGRLGWTHLAVEHAAGTTAFLAPLVPAMLEGSAPPDLFLVAPPEREDEALLEHGVLPHTLKRTVFVRTLEQVVFPGLDALGVDAGPGRAWLARRQAPAARASLGAPPIRPA